MGLKQAEYIVHGRVQGVGYRYFVYSRALECSLKGFARNQWDGSVLVVAEGDKLSLELLKGSLEKGPSMARVTKVDVEYRDFTGEFTSFEIQ